MIIFNIQTQSNSVQEEEDDEGFFPLTAGLKEWGYLLFSSVAVYALYAITQNPRIIEPNTRYSISYSFFIPYFLYYKNHIKNQKEERFWSVAKKPSPIPRTRFCKNRGGAWGCNLIKVVLRL